MEMKTSFEHWQIVHVADRLVLQSIISWVSKDTPNLNILMWEGLMADLKSFCALTLTAVLCLLLIIDGFTLCMSYQ